MRVCRLAPRVLVRALARVRRLAPRVTKVAKVSLAGLSQLLAKVSLAGLPLLVSHLLPVYFAFSSCLLHILCEFLHQA
jgi:hypothetical protein